MTETGLVSTRQQVRQRLVEVATRLLSEQGAAAVTTRGVAQSAGVQAPTIYRLFGDKDGLLEAVAEHVMASYVSTKATAVENAASSGADPVEDLRSGWDTHIAFGLANPPLFRLLHDPDRAAASPASAAGLHVLRARVHRVAAAGRLQVSEQRAVDLLQAAGTGAVMTLLAMPEHRRDLTLTDAMWTAVSQAILVSASPVAAGDTHGVIAAAVTLRAVVPELPTISRAEQMLMLEWLDRAISTTSEPAGHRAAATPAR